MELERWHNLAKTRIDLWPPLRGGYPPSRTHRCWPSWLSGMVLFWKALQPRRRSGPTSCTVGFGKTLRSHGSLSAVAHLQRCTKCTRNIFGQLSNNTSSSLKRLFDRGNQWPSISRKEPRPAARKQCKPGIDSDVGVITHPAQRMVTRWRARPRDWRGRCGWR